MLLCLDPMPSPPWRLIRPENDLSLADAKKTEMTSVESRSQALQLLTSHEGCAVTSTPSAQPLARLFVAPKCRLTGCMLMSKVSELVWSNSSRNMYTFCICQRPAVTPCQWCHSHCVYLSAVDVIAGPHAGHLPSGEGRPGPTFRGGKVTRHAGVGRLAYLWR